MRDSTAQVIPLIQPGSAAPSAPGWRYALPALVLALAWIVGWYWSTGAGMVGIWWRSETFAHGFVVPPIALWLIWRERQRLLRVAPRPGAWVLLPIAAVGFGWLLGELAAVNAVTQLALVALLVLAVPAVVGVPATRTIAFPLAFLFFAVPIGEFLMPMLMEWTADFTVMAIALSGIPVHREGQQFVIPSGSWSVVEACSGVRYLIASVVVGTLYAYLTYRSTTRRLAFIGVSILVPIVANWLRAYIIVMLGHLSGNKIAAGVDHLVYGWLFFGIVMLATFWIGARWREDEPASTAPARTTARSDTVPIARGFWLATGAVAALTAVWPIAYQAIERRAAASVAHLSSFKSIGSWRAADALLTDWQPRFEDPSAVLHQRFDRDGLAVGLYVGFYRDQTHGRKLVSSDNVLVASNDRVWAQVSGGTRGMKVGEAMVDVRTAELRRTDGQRLIARQWFWIDGRLTASDYWAKAWTAWAQLTGRGDDSAVIVVYSAKSPGDAADAALDAFVREAMPTIDAALRATRDAR